MIKIDDIEFDETDGTKAPRMSIWLDAHPYAKDNPPSLSISITGRAKQCTLCGRRQRLAPVMYVTTNVPGSNWRDLSDIELNTDTPNGANFLVWCGQPDDSDVLAYDLHFMSRFDTVFTLECHSDLMYGDDSDDSTRKFYVLCDVPLQHLEVGIPKTSMDPLGEATQLMKRWFDPSTWGGAILHEQRVPVDGPVVGFVVLYTPTGGDTVNNRADHYGA